VRAYRDEVVAPLELDVDLAPAVVRLLAAPHQAIVDGDRVEEQEDHHDGNDDEGDHGQSSCCPGPAMVGRDEA
jgi:hypothetical protein